MSLDVRADALETDRNFDIKCIKLDLDLLLVCTSSFFGGGEGMKEGFKMFGCCVEEPHWLL